MWSADEGWPTIRWLQKHNYIMFIAIWKIMSFSNNNNKIRLILFLPFYCSFPVIFLEYTSTVYCGLLMLKKAHWNLSRYHTQMQMLCMNAVCWVEKLASQESTGFTTDFIYLAFCVHLPSLQLPEGKYSAHFFHHSMHT